MDFRLAGAVRGGARRAAGGARRASSAGRPGPLAMHAGEVLSTDRIAEEIWAGDPPPSATRTVHSYVSRLRSALRDPDGGEDQLVRREPGYVLDVDPSGWTPSGSSGWSVGRSPRWTPATPESANADLREALGLWRGEALADFAYDAFAVAESQRLDGRRLEALELRIDTDLALGRHAQVVAELESLVVAHPLRERFWAQLMVALYRCGRQADALAAYGRVRRPLVDELGLEPGEELRLLESQVLDQSAELALPGAAAGGGPVRRIRRTRRPGSPAAGSRCPTACASVRTSGSSAAPGRPAGWPRRPNGRTPGRGRAVAARLGRGRPGQEHGGGRGGPRRVRRAGRACSPVTARRTSPAPTSCSSSRSVTTSYTHPTTSWPPVVDDQVAELAALLPVTGPAGTGSRPPPGRSIRTPSGTSCSPRWSTSVARIARDRTLVLVLDDLQWAD